MLLTASKADVAAITNTYGSLYAGETNTSNQITALTEGKIPGITQSNATNNVNTAIFTTTGANIDLLLQKAEFEQRTDAVKPKAAVNIEKVVNTYNGVDLATAHAQ